MRIEECGFKWALMAGTGVLLVAACSDTGNEPPPPPPPAGLTVARATPSGDAQSAAAGTELPDPIRVLVTRDGEPEAGVTVAWATSGAGSAMAPASNTTDAQGIAATTWTLRQAAGAATATASVTGASGSPVSFAATVSAGPATSLASAGGNNQTAQIGTELPNPLQVLAADEFGNPVAGVSVAWQVTAGGGSITPATSATNAAGAASAQLTVGAAAGPQAVQATATGLAGSPVNFNATATAAPAGSSTVIVGNDFFNPTTRTVASGTTVTWTWTNTGAIPHSVQSTGAPSFTSSAVLTGSGQTYSHTFNAAGTYTYECAVHGASMSGTVVVE